MILHTLSGSAAGITLTNPNQITVNASTGTTLITLAITAYNSSNY